MSLFDDEEVLSLDEAVFVGPLAYELVSSYDAETEVSCTSSLDELLKE